MSWPVLTQLRTSVLFRLIYYRGDHSFMFRVLSLHINICTSYCQSYMSNLLIRYIHEKKSQVCSLEVEHTSVVYLIKEVSWLQPTLHEEVCKKYQLCSCTVFLPMYTLKDDIVMHLIIKQFDFHQCYLNKPQEHLIVCFLIYSNCFCG